MEYSVEGALVCGGAPQVRVRRETEVLLEKKVLEKRRTHPLFYAFCCGAGALLAVFGLFAGMFLPHSAAAMAVAGRDTMMGSSLFGMAAELLRGSLPQADSAYSLLLQLFLAAAAGSAAFALGCSVLAFAAGRTARTLAGLSMTLTLVSFGGFSALVLLGAETGKAALSWDALFVFFGTLLLRTACIFVRRRGRGLSGLFLLLFSAAAYAGLCLPSSLFKQELIMVLSLPPVLWEKKEIALVVLLAVTALGLCLSLLRLGAQKGAPLDAVRFFLQCAAALGRRPLLFAMRGSRRSDRLLCRGKWTRFPHGELFSPSRRRGSAFRARPLGRARGDESGRKKAKTPKTAMKKAPFSTGLFYCVNENPAIVAGFKRGFADEQNRIGVRSV